MILTDQIINSIIVLTVLLVLSFATRRALKRFVVLKELHPNRKKTIAFLSNFLYNLVALMVLAYIWGVGLSEITLFLSSILAVLGVAFVAQWSHLSNLSASVILFLNHPVRIGDHIRIIDKDFEYVGQVKDITGFFFYLLTEKGEEIILPNTLVLQKGIELLNGRESRSKNESK